MIGMRVHLWRYWMLLKRIFFEAEVECPKTRGGREL
jgi:hypothetical protein